MATYPTHGAHLRHPHPNRWLLLAIAVIAALVGAGAWALVDHYAGGTTSARPGPAPLNSRVVAEKYIAALDKLDANALQPILAKNVVEIDKGFASTWPSAATLVTNWADTVRQSGHTGFRGNLCCAAPGWAAVTYRFWGSTNPLTHKPFKTNGLAVLKIKNGKIVRETLYWDVPGRKRGVAAKIGRKYATALSVPAWGALPKSPLYSKNAVRIDPAVTPSTSKVDHRIWANAEVTPLHASLCCAAPRLASDNGKMARSWAAVVWRARVGSTAKLSGISILELNRQGKIVREMLYYW